MKDEARIALIAGGSGTIGSEIAKLFVESGMHVILADRDSKGLMDIDDKIRELGKSATLIQVDFCDFNVVNELASSISNRFGVLDVFVSCFGLFGELSPMQDYEYDTLHSVFQVNFFANWYLLKCFDSLLKASKAGRSVFITSGAVADPASHPFSGPYVVSKSAVESMVMIYATETKHTNLCVNIIRPNNASANVHLRTSPGGKVSEIIDAPSDLARKSLELALPECLVTGQIFDLEKR